MNSRRVIIGTLLAAMLAVCAMSGGCVWVWGTKGETTAEAFALTGDYQFMKDATLDPNTGEPQMFTPNEPAPANLKPLDSFVVVSFYDWHDWFSTEIFYPPTYELLEARRLKGQGARLSYPLRIYTCAMILPIMGGGRTSQPDFGALAFAEGCWPVMQPGGGPSSFSTSQGQLNPPPPGSDGLLHCVFYPRTHPFDWGVARSANADWWLYRFLEHKLPEFCRLVDRSPDLTDAERRMVYSQLLDLVTAMQEFGVRRLTPKWSTMRDWVYEGLVRNHAEVLKRAKELLTKKAPASPTTAPATLGDRQLP